MMEAGDTRVFLRFYPGINFFSNGRKLFSQLERNFCLTGEILGINCGHGEELADEEELRRGDFFRIKDDIILAKSVSITEKAVYLRQFFANKVKTRCQMATQIHETPAKKLVYKKRIIIDILRSI